MSFKADGWALLLLCALGATAARAHQKANKEVRLADGQTSTADASPPEVSSQSLLLNPSDGLSVIGAALESRGRGRSKPDCSHLVHTVYERAGFPYAYVSSSDLYTGVAEFRQVTQPQAGDLVVWPGHVGIVVNPSRSTFFSSLRSGIGVESYTSSYWRDRGAHRFYRYVKVTATKNRETKGETRDFMSAALDNSRNAEEISSADANPMNINLPHSQVIESSRPQPREITKALLMTFSVNSKKLQDVNVFNLPQSLIVFSKLEVRAVKVHGDEGWAQVRIISPFSVTGGQANMSKQQETQTWLLRRQDQRSWELLLPQNSIFMPQDIAAQVLAHQLELLADTEAANLRQKSRLSEMLNRIPSQ